MRFKKSANDKRHLQRIDCMTEGIVYLISYRGFFKRFRFAAKKSLN